MRPQTLPKLRGSTDIFCSIRQAQWYQEQPPTIESRKSITAGIRMKRTIIEVAKLAAVSPKTVSRVINNEPGVRESTKKRVWKAAKLINYRPSLCARQLKGAATSIGFVYDALNCYYVMNFQQGILNTCLANGLELFIRPLNINSDGIVDQVLEMVERTHLSGLILTPPFSEMTELLSALNREKVSFVKVVSSHQQVDSCTVSINDFQAAYDLTQHLLKLNHHKLAFLKGSSNHFSTEQRLAGTLACLTDNQFPLQYFQVIDGEYSFVSGRIRASYLFNQEVRPSAIIACNDEIAAGALYAAQEHRLSVPKELSVVGFEDSPISRQVWPNLTTANQNNIEIAQAASELLVANIKKQPPPPMRVFTPRLVIRASTLHAAN